MHSLNASFHSFFLFFFFLTRHRASPGWPRVAGSQSRSASPHLAGAVVDDQPHVPELRVLDVHERAALGWAASGAGLEPLDTPDQAARQRAGRRRRGSLRFLSTPVLGRDRPHKTPRRTPDLDGVADTGLRRDLPLPRGQPQGGGRAPSAPRGPSRHYYSGPSRPPYLIDRTERPRGCIGGAPDLARRDAGRGSGGKGKGGGGSPCPEVANLACRMSRVGGTVWNSTPDEGPVCVRYTVAGGLATPASRSVPAPLHPSEACGTFPRS